MTKLRHWWRQKVVPVWGRYKTLMPLVLLFMFFLAFLPFTSPDRNKPDTKPLDRLYSDIASGGIKDVVIVDDHREVKVDLKQGEDYLVIYPTDYGDELTMRLEAAKIPVRVEGKNWTEKYQSSIAILFSAVMLLTILFVLVSTNRIAGLRGGMRSSGVNVAPAQTPTERFSDVGGADEVIAEFRQTVDALKNPEKYRRFGVKPLTGFLLYGEPGTGKTLLARAIAGEAGVPFFATKGSDFMGRWLNDGPRAVREIFAQARKCGVAIIFIDEIESIASKRSSNDDSGSKELNNTVNEVLAQLDGFGNQDDGTVLVIGATNRPDDLDPGIKRPGRLTRHAVMPSPDPKARKLILELHAKALGKLDADINFEKLARLTSGMTGAQLAHIVNQAGLLAINEATEHEPVVTMKHFLEALETAEVGVARKSREVAARDRTITAIHESGHTLVALLLKDAPKPHRVTIIPRGVSGGHTRMDEGDEMLRTVPELKARLACVMGGRAAEKLILGEGNFTTGAEHDLAKATEIATFMVTRAGMGGVYTAQVAMGNGHDPRLAEVTDEIDKLVKQAETDAMATLVEHREMLETLRDVLLEVESLDAEAIAKLFPDNVTI